MNRLFRILVIIVSAFCCLSCTETYLSDDTNDEYTLVNAGDKLPAFSVYDNYGNTISNVSLKGYVSIIIFFNTRCPDCQAELPVINEVYKSLADKDNIKFIAISRAEDSDLIASFWKEHDLSLPYSAQIDRTIYNKFATQTIPRIYIIDKNNIIRYTYNDENMPDVKQLTTNIISM